MKPTLYLVIAVLGAAVGFGIYRYGIEPRLSADTPAAPDAAATPPAQASAATAPADATGIPDVLPDFTLADLEGKPRSIQSWPGKAMVVNFWATWCAPCRREIPLLNALHDEHSDEGFQFVGVAVDVHEDVVKFAREIGIRYPVLTGEQEGIDAVGRFGQGSLGFPFTVFTDNQHRIVMYHVGEIERAEADVLLGVVSRVNSGELTPAAARSVAAKQLASLSSDKSEG